MKKNKLVLCYLLNVIISFVLLILKLEGKINCSVFVCLLPIIIPLLGIAIALIILATQYKNLKEKK